MRVPSLYIGVLMNNLLIIIFAESYINNYNGYINIQSMAFSRLIYHALIVLGSIHF